MFELFAIGNTLSSEEVSEDADHDIIDVIGGVLDDGVGEEEDNSDVLEAVGGEQSGHSVEFNDVTDLDGGLIGVALVEHLLAFLEEGQNFLQIVEIVVLGQTKNTFLSF